MTEQLIRALGELQRKWVPDRRIGVFDVALQEGRIEGSTTSREAQAEVRRIGSAAGLEVAVTLLPNATVDSGDVAVVTAALAPLLERPAVRAPRVNEAVQGEPLTLLERKDDWLRVRGGDGYVAWIHSGYVRVGLTDWFEGWLRQATIRSLGCELEYQGERVRLPIGARLAPLREGSGVETADGRLARVVAGVVRSESELHAEARLMAIPQLALRWFGGAPYLWGGRTEWGVDCSGLVQAVYAARGLALPRDSDQQAASGEPVALSGSGAGYAVGDLLFFAERERISHVALWAGSGRIVHSTLSRGGVVSEDLFADQARLKTLREQLVVVRRVER
ncbi:MAG TPA: SH3 domain-containing C40 family peptidase [Gemmatimonadales bacterium]|nr:SH3 domain-containing C40 family peptidase [Gemmatimonadales bacterium]